MVSQGAVLNTPVILLVFNRPDLTARLIERLATMRPSHVLVICDGPRNNRAADVDCVNAVRAQFTELPWECRIDRDFSPINLGCAKRISSGLTWAFALVDEAIILEDDCLPDPSFFQFAGELLARYRDVADVASVCGTSPGFIPSSPFSYRFSRYSFIWGWATWARAWKKYDFEMTSLSDGSIDAVLRRAGFGWWQSRYWKYVFQRVKSGKINTWDYQWVLTCWKEGMVHAVPNASLVENIGFGRDSSHTTHNLYGMPAATALRFPLAHPDTIEVDREVDRETEGRIFSRTLGRRIAWAIQTVARKLRS